MSESIPAPHWHDENPYADRLVYVPIEELAVALSGGTVALRDGSVVPVTPGLNLTHWARSGNALDAYVLEDGTSAGIRYGSAPEAYLSPHVRDPEAVRALMERCRDARPAASPGGP